MVGPAYGNVCFYAAREVDERHVRVVRLVGFGGNTTMSLQELSRGPVGCPFLSFGNMRDITTQSMGTQQRSFVIYNRGPLNGMAVVRIKATAKDDNVFEKPNIAIWPAKCIIGPDSYQQISITFQPRRSDLKKLLRKQAPVITIAMLEVIYGDDPNRQRIAALIDRTDVTYKPLDFLLADFVNEQPVDFTDFKESSVSAIPYWSFCRIGFKTLQIFAEKRKRSVQCIQIRRDRTDYGPLYAQRNR